MIDGKGITMIPAIIAAMSMGRGRITGPRPRGRRGRPILCRRPGLMFLAAAGLVLAAGVFAACRSAATPTPWPTLPPTLPPTATAVPGMILAPELGGATTAFTVTRNAFGLPARNLEAGERRAFAVGNSFFRQNWVTAPASTEARDGLGPTFNALSCSSCHHLDGRGKPPDGPDDGERGLLIRLSVPGRDAVSGGPLPEPVYGGQLQDRAIMGVPAEGRLVISYREVAGSFADGERYSLRHPEYGFRDLAFGPMHPDTLLSPRVAPAIVGMGLLEAIPAADIRAAADPEDADGDGISGRVNMVWDARRGGMSLGRFGWKANQPTVEQQTAGAFLGDLGITSALFPGENCPDSQGECQAAPNGGEPEIGAERLGKVTLYTQTLAVPAMRGVDDPAVQRGARLFAAAGCAVCHTPMHVTGEHPVAALSGQVIYPYTDLLLHDMGPELADGRPDFGAGGQEWRTPPLWGIGLVATVNGHTLFLHDGRARGLVEAILWHGGEGAAARDAFKGFDQDARDALIRFLESL